jgi:4-hydroxy-tetrahydrodipicolinate synthase
MPDPRAALLPTEGIHTALVTPFAADGAVDLAAFRALCERQRRAGVQGLVPCGTTGETPTLEDAEWEALVRVAVEVGAGELPVTAGVGTNNTKTTVANVRRAADLGATAGLLVLPYYNKPNAAGLREHVKRAAGVGLPLVVYHVPGRTGQRVGERLLAELCDVEGVVAVKEATGDVRYGADLMHLTRRPVLSGDDFTFLGLLAQGAAGCISVLSNVVPAETVAIWRAHREGRHDDARRLLEAQWALVRFLFADPNPVPCKAVMAAMGLCRADVRLPLAPWEGPIPPGVVPPPARA